MLASGREHQKCFGFGRYRFVGAIKEDRSDFLRERGSARFPGLDGDVPLSP
ncbi:MAG: hypothetical protein NTNFB01_26040 [Nitrospira sp.]